MLALCLAFFTTACSGDSDSVQRAGSNVTYDDIRNTGKANDCPTISDSARGSIPLTVGGQYELRGICMHPVQVYAKEEPANIRQEAEFVEGKILTRFTSSLDEVFGDLADDRIRSEVPGEGWHRLPADHRAGARRRGIPVHVLQ